ncbi:MAG: C10 family peptidase [Aeriscardovia sp.]|nr:C10 family peptidase [Aeriscardovia sp.]MBP3833650.1 C10 family peptidase [Bacteroidaceae bacterium]
MKKILFFVASAIFLLAACNNNDEVLTSLNHDNPQVPNEFAISNDEAKEVLNLFLSDGPTTRGDGKATTVKDYRVRNVEITAGNDTEIVPVYEYATVNESGDEGYAIVVGDRRIQKVLVQVDKGSLADTIDIEPLRLYINSIPYIIKGDLIEYEKRIANDAATTRAQNDFSVDMYGPYLNTQWTQNYPYNNSCPDQSCSSGQKTLTGCTALAIARLLAYHQKPAYMSWSAILQNPTLTSSSPAYVINQVSSLIYYIGHNLLNATYSCNNTYVSETSFLNVPNVLSSYSLSSYGLEAFNKQIVIESIQQARPVFLSAKTSDGAWRNDWVCDGWKRHNYDTTYYDYLYMRWGYPYSEGFFYIDDSGMSFTVNGVTYSTNFRMIANIH